MQYSEDQEAALDKFREWREAGASAPFVLTGLAGTGKSTLLRAMWDQAPGQAAAPTGKAASVLRSKGLPARTIHSLFYRLVSEGPGSATGERGLDFEFSGGEGADGPLYIDEASMVTADVLRDLQSLGTPLVFVGDPGQLPPIGVDPGLLNKPTAKLEQIHRQALESPIVRFAHYLREGGHPSMFRDGGDGLKIISKRGLADVPLEDLAEATILTGSNSARTGINVQFAKKRDTEERVVILRNDRKTGYCNGDVLELVDVVRDARGNPK